MDEDVFLVLVPLGFAMAAMALIFLRRWENQFCWERFRVSTAIWTTVVTLTVAGFVNLSDAPLLLSVWILLSGVLVLRVIRHPVRLSNRGQLAWILLLLTPGGWLLFFTRFPNFHGVDASACRFALAGSSRVGPRP